MAARGIRNNNPLNIRISGQNWKGKVIPSQDPAFEQFQSMTYGIRAAIKIVQTYIRRYNLNSPALIIARWAPAIENNVTRYVNFVHQRTGFAYSTRLHADSKFDICRLLWAMAIYENGEEVPFEQFTQAWTLL